MHAKDWRDEEADTNDARPSARFADNPMVVVAQALRTSEKLLTLLEELYRKREAGWPIHQPSLDRLDRNIKNAASHPAFATIRP